MNRETSTDYQAVNRVGRIVKTFSDIEIGRAWVRENSSFYGRLELLEVETVVTTRRVYRPRPKPVQSLAIPPRQEARLCA
ncbi:hypothetical protein [Brevundimonas diminuta]|uniref:hypothetical protein n=1 Tax=Brevundimonas diminuta TaxID=293 RepID=UPI00320BAE74